MSPRPIPLALCSALLALAGSPARAGEPPDPVHHALVQKKVGFYDVYLPPDPADEATPERRWPICVLLHEGGLSEAELGDLSSDLGRRGVIYVVPRAAHATAGSRGRGRPGWSAWPVFPESWGGWESARFPKAEVERLRIERLATDWIADCVAAVRERYRADERRVVAIGHGQGAVFAQLLAVHRPEIVRAYFAYAGYYRRAMEDDLAALTLKKHEIRPVLAHCRGDPAVELRETQMLSKYLLDREVEHECLIFPGGSHAFTSRVTRAMQEFVARRCRGEELAPLQGELVVTEVAAGSPAEEVGIAAGDVVTSYNGRPVRNRDDLVAAEASVSEGQEKVAIAWRRGEEELEDTVPPGRLGATLADR